MKWREENFYRFGKTFDCVPRKDIWWLLRSRDVMEKEVFGIMEMYKNIKPSLKIDDKQSKEVEVKTECSVLIPFFYGDNG